MRRILTLVCIFLATIATAAPVSKEQAMEQAAAFLAQKNPSAAKRNLHMAARAQQLNEAVTDAACYYIFNIGLNGGFVIVSGDDRTEPILGYSDEGPFLPDRVPANMQAWLDGYAQQLRTLSLMDDAQARQALRAPRHAAVATRNSIAPLITTKWDQATPYWNECPQFMNSDDEADGYELAYTGCVATAMSQIMYFHKQPAQTLAEIPAYTFTYGDGNYNYVTVNMDALPVTTFDWAHMRETYTGAEPEAYTAAVAHLMYYVGCSVKMQYGRNSSGAYTDDIPNGFRYFGYGSKIAFRNDYTQQAWDDLVYSELAAGRPMIYNGTAGSGGGHSFVCDGFAYGDYFHINWGWGGMGNGFFQLSILNPSASGIGGSSSSEGYNMKQNIIYNILPGTATPESGTDNPDDEDPILTATNISGPTAWSRDRVSDDFKIFKSKILKVSFSDHSGTGKKFKEALALYDPSDGTYSILPNSETNAYLAVTTSALGETHQFGGGVASNAADVIKFGAGLTGLYRLVPMYQLQGSSQWLPMKESDRYYVELNMTGTNCQATYHPQVSLTTTDWAFSGSMKVGSKVQVHATIRNNSSDRFFGDVYLDFGGQQLDENSQFTTVVQAEVPAGQESVVTFNVTPANAGTLTVKTMLPGDYSGYYNTIGSTTVNIAESQEAELDLSVEIEAVDAQPAGDERLHGIIYDSSARFRATIHNHSAAEYNKYVLAPLFICTWDAQTGKYSGSMVTYKQQTVTIPAGQSATYYFDFDNLAYGSTYSMNIYARNNVPQEEDASHVDNIVGKGESKYYEIQRGIITWKGDGTRKGHKPENNFAIPDDAAAVSLEGLQLSSITPSSNPNTLFFLSEGQTAPEGLDGKNVVVGSQADNIALLDGYDFFTPQTFTASAISYTRTFEQGHNNSIRTGWSTLVLPFQPNKVVCLSDGKTLDWFRSASDSGKQFWLCDFAEEDGDRVCFRNAPEMLPNVPYLVAVPDNAWGPKWDLRGKPIQWRADNVTLKPDAVANTSGQLMVFAGSACRQQLSGILSLTADGSQFSTLGPQTLEPFRACFKTVDGSALPAKALAIAILGDETSGMVQSLELRPQNSDIYDLSGRKIAVSSTSSVSSELPKGIYIVNGQKFVIR